MQLQKKSVPLHRNSAIAKVIGLWCNGNTADSGPAFPGSSPGSPTFHQLARASLGCRHHLLGLWCNGNTADSGPAFPGSSPGSPTKPKESLFIMSKLSFLFIYTSASLYRQCRRWLRLSPEPTQDTRQDASLPLPLRWGQATGPHLSVMLYVSMPLRRRQDRRGRGRRTRCNC